MEYQLGIWQTLEAKLIAESILGTMFFIGIFVVLPIFLYIIVPHRLFKILVVVVCISINGASFLSVLGSGWKIERGAFHIKAYSSSDNVNILSMEISFVNIESEWKPSWRDLGAGLPKLSVGNYKLENKKKALVFNHYRQDKLLLISSEDKYYLIGHPNIETLYDELIRLGAKEKSFENKWLKKEKSD